MAKDFEFKGVWIPSRVFTDARLTQSDKFLFGLIYLLCNERGCFASREALAEYMGQSVRNTQYSISRLTECGYVRKDENDVLWDIISHTIDRGEIPFTKGVKVSSPKGRKSFHPDRYKGIDIDDTKAPEVLVQDEFIRSDAELSKVWDEWLVLRRSRRWSASNEYVAKWNEMFKGWGATKATQAVKQSLLQGWQGLFEPRVGTNTRSSQAKGDSDHASGF